MTAINLTFTTAMERVFVRLTPAMLVFLLALLPLSALAGEFTCTAVGYHAHPADCSQFYRCTEATYITIIAAWMTAAVSSIPALLSSPV